MKKFKMPSLLQAYKNLDISKAKNKTKSYILEHPKIALLVVLLATTLVLGSTAYYTGIIDSFIKDSTPYVEVNLEAEPEVKTVPSAIPHTPDVIGTPSFPKVDNKVSEDTSAVEENFITPAEGEIIRDFGFNYSKTYKDYRFHDGIDIEVPQGAIVQAAADGKVVKVSHTEIERYTITIDHGSYLQTHYKHLCEVNVTKGDTLKQGQEIGKINNPDSHLHFGIIYKGDNEDPTKYLEELKAQIQ